LAKIGCQRGRILIERVIGAEPESFRFIEVRTAWGGEGFRPLMRINLWPTVVYYGDPAESLTSRKSAGLPLALSKGTYLLLSAIAPVLLLAPTTKKTSCDLPCRSAFPLLRICLEGGRPWLWFARASGEKMYPLTYPKLRFVFERPALGQYRKEGTLQPA